MSDIVIMLEEAKEEGRKEGRAEVIDELLEAVDCVNAHCCECGFGHCDDVCLIKQFKEQRK